MPNYLYNGIELPELPEWDKETYPYARLSANGDLFVAEGAPYIYKNGVLVLTADCAVIYTVMWGDDWAVNQGNSWGENSRIAGSTQTAEITIWANYDILNEDGTLYLAASDPVPVTQPINRPEQIRKGILYGLLMSR